MAMIRKFCCNDLLRFTSVNLDHLTTTTEMSFYLTCLAKRCRYFFHAAVAPGNRIIGYIIGKTEKESKAEQFEGEASEDDVFYGDLSESEISEREAYEREAYERENRERERELWETLALAMSDNLASDSEEEPETEHWQGLLVAVHVAPEYRRVGFATRLMQSFEKHLVEKMLLCPRGSEYYTFVHVVEDNTPAKLFFKQCGYRVIRITKDFYMNDEDEEINSYEMRKELYEEED